MRNEITINYQQVPAANGCNRCASSGQRSEKLKIS